MRVDATKDRGGRKHLESAAHRKWLIGTMAGHRAGRCIEHGNPEPAAALRFQSGQFPGEIVVEARTRRCQTCPGRQRVSDEGSANRPRKFTSVGHPNRLRCGGKMCGEDRR
jgi:hypothetical protein